MKPEDERPNPDALLAQMQRQQSQGQPGRLHIFLGMCPGVGKTYAMLQAGRQRAKEGVNVLAGVVETHGRHETAALLEDLPVLPRKRLDHRGFSLEEFDLDEVLRRRPQLVLVDELAHTNAPGSRHAKRYQDVLELMDAGLDVYTTLNVQHIESQVDIVQQISGVTIQEKVPDSLLDRAHEIQLIDLSAEKLLQRMAEGKVYLGERAEHAVSNFFKEGTLTALRELALRFTAERVDRDLDDIRRVRRVTSAWKTNARLLVGVGPSPYAESLIRWTRRAAARLDGPWIVAWVEKSAALTAAEQEVLTRALGLARRLGAEVVSLTGDDVAEALLQLARERNVSQIVVGKPDRRGWGSSLADRIIAESGDIDVCVVRPVMGREGKIRVVTPAAVSASQVEGYSWALALTFILTSLCWALLPVTGYTFAALVLLLGVMGAGMRFSRGPVLAMATVSALVWNYFFIPPQFTLHIDEPEDMLMFGMFFLVAFSMGHLTTRLRQREEAERRRQRQTAALLSVTQSAALTAESGKGLQEAVRIITDLLQAGVSLVLRQGDHTLSTGAHEASNFQPNKKEWGVVGWSFDHKQAAGRFTDTLPESDATWFPLQTATSTMGVMGIRLGREVKMDFTMRQTVEAFALQLALVLEKEHFIQAASRAEVLEQSEKLRQTLLDSVSHELKTPLAVIQASLEGLREEAGASSPYAGEIATATERLQRVVDHLLQMTRIESAVMQPSLDWCDIRDVIQSARAAAGPALNGHPLRLRVQDDMPPVKMDAALMAQALANILHNAAAYTPEGTAIEIRAGIEQGCLRLAVRDHGTGFPGESALRVFEKFYRAPGTPAGGTGLGLAIARGFVQAQGGRINAHNHPEGGAEVVIEVDHSPHDLPDH
ncbi:two-component system sensor histidine kinase KdpD [Prosthecobacter fusiformis]|uniref:histidine kinase n=1 Tax=Prosthecobacter fusiformis TaxID=48464 RepID=A0A4R7RXQ4_9BACT|nr:sensor histidine kinase KdpD [Prosthecobacter fusiformis]TDU70640.1 two-component system sensor histidine kinase KdpD [Prosthecobacter fusiformis]